MRVLVTPWPNINKRLLVLRLRLQGLERQVDAMVAHLARTPVPFLRAGVKSRGVTTPTKVSPSLKPV